MKSLSVITGTIAICPALNVVAAEEIIHDGEFNYLMAQHGEKWAKQDKVVDAKLADIRKKMVANGQIYSISWSMMSVLVILVFPR